MNRKSRRLLPILAIAMFACQTLADVPATQQAIVQTGNGGPEVLALQTVPVLDAGPGQVLIQVHAAAVNPVDWKTREGYSGRERPVGTPPPDEPPARIPGFDASGIIAATGPGVTDLSVGDAVFTMIGRMTIDGLNGGYSQYVVAPADHALRNPEGFTFVEAAGLGTVGLAAARMLSPVDIQPGQRVFVNGIAGGVGSSAAQMAMARGAVAIGTASARHHDYLESIGVEQIIDYTQVNFEDVVEPVDLYVETVSPDFATRGLQIIKPGGRIVSVVGSPAAELCEEASVDCPELGPPPGAPPGGPPGARPGGPAEPPGGPPPQGGVTEAELLEQVRQLADEGKYRVNVDRTFPLAQAGDAQEYNREGHTTGKVILIVDQAL